MKTTDRRKDARWSVSSSGRKVNPCYDIEWREMNVAEVSLYLFSWNALTKQMSNQWLMIIVLDIGTMQIIRLSKVIVWRSRKHLRDRPTG